MQQSIIITGNHLAYIKSREKLAEYMNRRAYGKEFFYSISEFANDKVSGICIIDHITYDKLFDTFIYTIKDRNTGTTYITERCNLCLISTE